MTVWETIIKRFSNRDFNTNDINISVIEKILRTAEYSPYPKTAPNWHTIIFLGEEKKKLNKFLLECLMQRKITGFSTHNSIKTCIKAPVLLLVISKYADSVESINDTLMNHSYIQSTGAYIQNILLCATDLGVGSLWVNDILFYKDEISEYVKETDLLVSGVLLGKCRTNVDHASLTKQENFYVYRK